MRYIISGGGSGGHIFPAIAIAKAIEKRHSDADILFVGAKGRMEMEKVPAAGYRIEGLPIAGLQRKMTLRNIGLNLLLPFKIIRSHTKARNIIRTFEPQVVIGVGGYASQPTLKAAGRMHIPIVIQEQNSFAGLTNRTLARYANVICVAYDGMERFFPAEKIVMTGNPVREEIEHAQVEKSEALTFFGLDSSRPVILSVGGSLGASSINRAIMHNLSYFCKKGIQLLWQTGRYMHDEAVAAVEAAHAGQWVKVHPFIARMDMAYAAADTIISRAGALAISELTHIGKPLILIPSPNVAEDHQTKNAMALVEKGAAMLLTDSQCSDNLTNTLNHIMDHPEEAHLMAEALHALRIENTADKIVDQIDKLTT